MSGKSRVPPLWSLSFVLCGLHVAAALAGQSVPQPAPQAQASGPVAAGVSRSEGTEPSSGIQYLRLIRAGSLRAANEDASVPPAPDPPPVLIAQCSLRHDGKYVFEIFASFGGAVDLNFYPPWKPKDSHDLFPPTTAKATLSMAFLGYTHVKPFRRQWEIPVETPGLYRYNSPGSRSSNLDEPAYFLRYLLSLPTLELTLNDRVAGFETAPLLTAIRKETLCRAAGL